MSGFDDLQAAVADLQQAVASESAELDQVVAGLTSATQQIADLQNQIASGGSAVTEAQLEDVANSLTTIAEGAKASTQAAQAATGVGPSEPEVPSDAQPVEPEA